MASLASARLKVGRAHEHVRTFNQRVQGWLEGEPYRVTRHLERDGAEHVYRVEGLTQPPPDLGTVIGDVAHNLMSALDSIVWDLSATAIPTLSEGERQSIGFPIAKDAKRYNASAARFASPAAQAEIERSQPYHGDAPALEELWTIREVNRIDKHRHVIVVPALTMGSWWRTRGLSFEEFTHPIGPLEDGAELARFRFETPQPEVDMEFGPMINVALGEREPAGYVLDRLVEHVETTIIPRFEPFF